MYSIFLPNIKGTVYFKWKLTTCYPNHWISITVIFHPRRRRFLWFFWVVSGLFQPLPGYFSFTSINSYNVLDCKIATSQLNVNFYYKTGQSLLQSWPALMCCKEGQVLLQSRTAFLHCKPGNWYCNVRQVLQSRIGIKKLENITNRDNFCYQFQLLLQSRTVGLSIYPCTQGKLREIGERNSFCLLISPWSTSQQKIYLWELQRT